MLGKGVYMRLYAVKRACRVLLTPPRCRQTRQRIRTRLYLKKKWKSIPLRGIDNTRKRKGDDSTRRQKYTACMIPKDYESEVQSKEMMVVRE